MTIKVTPLAALVEDTAIYPRHSVDEMHVNSLVLALRAGVVLPPIVAEARSTRIVDGWHRVRAYRKVLGPQASVDVDLRTYKSDGDLLSDAVALNASHGRRLDRVDQVRAIHLLEVAGVQQERIAIVLHIPETRVEQLRVRIAIAEPLGGGVPETIALKRPALHLAGTELSQEQRAVHDSMAGTSFLLQAHQLRDALRLEFVNRADARLIEALRELQQALEVFLVTEDQAA